MFSIVYSIVVSPIELMVEIVFEFLFRILGHAESNVGFAVIGVSVCISLLTLPLYNRADAVQQRERGIREKLSGGIKRIRTAFKGDERFMMLQTYYRENNYSPLYALAGSVTLLLEIPFFIAAYHFLSHLEVLKGVSFGPIGNLGQADGLLHIGGRFFNMLPVLMTAINCLSAAIYLQGFPLKNKIQTYGMALIFLVLLYRSPSGLVIYWTCNNIFSLLKNMFYRYRNFRKLVTIACPLVGTVLSLLISLSGILNSRKKYLCVILFWMLSFLPLIVSFIGKKPVKYSAPKVVIKKNAMLFLFGAIFLTILLGVLIPSSVIASSPSEFVDISDYRNPLYFLIHSTCYAAGFFLVWLGVIYLMILPRGGGGILYLAGNFGSKPC